MVCVTTPSYTIALSGSHFGFFKGKRGLRQGDPLSPLLFVVCLEYFTRILNVATELKDFTYHPLCKHLKLSHLAFVDDLLLFCKGNVAFVNILLRDFDTFSAASGLEMNQTKSDIYLNGVDGVDKQRILNRAGFKLGSFPFRYLGVPICYKRLSGADCAKLEERMVVRIRSRGSKFLSYAGRLVLVQSILSHVHSYWARIFLLPKPVIYSVEKICRNYLWGGTADHQRIPLIAWKKCCLPKMYGGLGIVNCQLWNVAFLGKYTWWMVKNKASLWVDWVKQIYVKGQNWWDYEATVNSSWTWRKISEVKSLIKDGVEKLCAANDMYNVAKIYHGLLNVSEKWRWKAWVWNRVSIPNYRFNSWLIFHGRLLTKYRLSKIGVVNDGKCVLCGDEDETLQHLYFECTYSKCCLQLMQDWLKIVWREPVMEWVYQWRCKSLIQKMITMAALFGVMYSIWYSRNVCRVEMSLQLPKVVVDRVKMELLAKMQDYTFSKELELMFAG